MAYINRQESTPAAMTAEQRRKLFYLFKLMGFEEDDRHGFIESWTDGRTASMTGLTFMEAMEMIRRLEEANRTPQEKHKAKEQGAETMDRKRKGVIKAISAYLEQSGMKPSIDYVKGIAVRASGIAPTGDTAHDFNRIGAGSLTRIYNEFCLKQRVRREKQSVPVICLN